MPVFLDLCSGLGGASEAFTQQGWTVIRVENNPELEYVPHTRILDVLEWADWIDQLPRCDVIWASPPCTEFSTASSVPRSVRGEPDMSIVQACLDIIDYMKPRVWVLENVQGACRYFEPLIGWHQQRIGPFFLWGQFPRITMPFDFRYKKNMGGAESRKRTAQEVACIPFEISLEFARVLEQQWTLRRWYA
tara:strand:- start:312 stop:884 length:573 start_codon:yes stop_codon:yes gene_type:complete